MPCSRVHGRARHADPLQPPCAQVLRGGSRIAACMSRYFGHRQMFAATCNSLMLSKSLRQRMWPDSAKTCMQLPMIGQKQADRLAAAGVATLQ
jgi:hypothetical protein